jgi:hypothetical protein
MLSIVRFAYEEARTLLAQADKSFVARQLETQEHSAHNKCTYFNPMTKMLKLHQVCRIVCPRGLLPNISIYMIGLDQNFL